MDDLTGDELELLFRLFGVAEDVGRAYVGSQDEVDDLVDDLDDRYHGSEEP
jgi:hypothetical protein